VRLVRTLPGPIERVWEYLTDSEKRARWFGGGVLEQKAGGKVEFNMVHKNLAPKETPPAKYAQVQDPGVTFEGRVLRCEPPRLLAYTFGSDDSEVTFELTPQGKQVLLVLTHRTRGAEEQAELTTTRRAGTRTSPTSSPCSRARNVRRSGRCMPNSWPTTRSCGPRLNRARSSTNFGRVG